MGWTDNSIMFWSLDEVTWNKITDHNRSPLDISYQRFGKTNRMADATLRRYSVAKKRTFSCSWTNLPAKRNFSYGGRTALTTVDNGFAGEEIEAFYYAVDGAFKMKLRKGADEAKLINDTTIETVTVMITEFSKTVVKRGIVDLWDVDVTLEEV